MCILGLPNNEVMFQFDNEIFGILHNFIIMQLFKTIIGWSGGSISLFTKVCIFVMPELVMMVKK
jgi:hypothetical protein